MMAVAFIGHRKISVKKQSERLRQTTEQKILNEQADTFLFVSKSMFDMLCYGIVTDLKNKHPYIRRIYVRAEYEYISDDYGNYLLEHYEDTVFSAAMHHAGTAAYIKRNEFMIETCNLLIVCPKNRRRASRVARNLRSSMQLGRKRRFSM